MILLLSLVLAADGDVLGGVTLGQAWDAAGAECRESGCQGHGTVYGIGGTLAVKRCGTVAKTAQVSVSHVLDSADNHRKFGSYMVFAADPRATALGLFGQLRDAHLADGWVVESERDEDGLPWMRVVKAPHARLLRVTTREALGQPVYTALVLGAATDLGCE